MSTTLNGPLVAKQFLFALFGGIGLGIALLVSTILVVEKVLKPWMARRREARRQGTKLVNVEKGSATSSSESSSSLGSGRSTRPPKTPRLEGRVGKDLASPELTLAPPQLPRAAVRKDGFEDVDVLFEPQGPPRTPRLVGQVGEDLELPELSLGLPRWPAPAATTAVAGQKTPRDNHVLDRGGLPRAPRLEGQRAEDLEILELTLGPQQMLPPPRAAVRREVFGAPDAVFDRSEKAVCARTHVKRPVGNVRFERVQRR